MAMAVVQVSETVGQAEGARPQECAQPIRNPFGQKINPSFATVLDISAQVQEFVSGDRFEAPFGQPSTDAWPQPPHGEGDQADVRFSLPQIQTERHFRLQSAWIDLEVHEESPLPVGKHKQLALPRHQPAFGVIVHGASLTPLSSCGRTNDSPSTRTAWVLASPL